jgi:hypothetical protein
MRDKYAKSKWIDAAITAIQREEFIIYSDAINYYKCNHSAVSWHIHELIKSRKEALSF